MTNVKVASGAVMVSSFDSTLEIRESTFSNLRETGIEGILSAYECDVTIENSTFEDFGPAGIVIEHS